MSCVFCEIIAGRSPATVRYEDDDVMVIDNVLRWAPVMMLAIPKKHLTQTELWNDMAKVAKVATEVGQKCCPAGFRLISNFGHDALQTQPHAHVHILGGMFLGHYL